MLTTPPLLTEEEITGAETKVAPLADGEKVAHQEEEEVKPAEGEEEDEEEARRELEDAIRR